jgi:hypothetical protein
MRMKLLGATALIGALAVPGLAQDSEKKEEKTVERIVIMEHGKDHKTHKGGETRIMRMHSKGDGAHHHFVMADCDGDKTEVDEATGKEKTRIILCGKGGLSAEDRVKELEEIRTRLAQNDHLGAEHRAKIEAALQRAIDRLRARD